MFDLIAHSLTLSLSLAAMAGPCDLLDKAAASALLGEPVASVDAGEPEEDEDTGGMVVHCGYRGANGMVVVSQLTFRDAAAARTAVTKEAISARMEGDLTELVEDTGIGDKSFWAYNARAAQYMVLKGSRVVAILVGGVAGQAPQGMRAKLRTAITNVAGKL